MNVDGSTGQTYHYRALAINFGGITYGPDQTFTTLDVPEVISETARRSAAPRARLNALVQPSLSPTTVRFEYGTSTAYGASTRVPIGWRRQSRSPPSRRRWARRPNHLPLPCGRDQRRSVPTRARSDLHTGPRVQPRLRHRASASVASSCADGKCVKKKQRNKRITVKRPAAIAARRIGDRESDAR